VSGKGKRVQGVEGSRVQVQRKRYPARVVGGTVSEDLFERGLCLPSGTAMTNDDLDRVIETVIRCPR